VGGGAGAPRAYTLVKPEYSSVVTVWISVQQITSDTTTCRGPRAGLRETAAAWMAPGRGLVRRGGGVRHGGGGAARGRSYRRVELQEAHGPPHGLWRRLRDLDAARRAGFHCLLNLEHILPA
jgi:hypothetical protein